jgi:hypothetical protein
MSTVKCLGCGRDTNTTLCDWADHEDYQPRRCWAAADYENNLWVKGCGYDQLGECFDRDFADGRIGKPLFKSKEEIIQSLFDYIKKED